MTTSWSGNRRAFPPATRRRILTRDHHRCVNCGHHDPTGRTLTADHIVPAAEGGTDHETNGQTLCDFGTNKPSCHRTKTLDEIARGQARRPQRRRARPPHPGATAPDPGG